MHKNIKFFIVMNGKEIRTLDDLRDNFHAQDILSLYQGGVLRRWLESEGMTEYVAKIDAIDGGNTKTDKILQALIDIFFVESDISIEDIAHYIYFLHKNSMALKELKENNFERDKVINDYHKRYAELKELIVEGKNDMPRAREVVRDIANNCMPLFVLDFSAFIKKLKKEAPAVILILLTNKSIRNWLVASKNEELVIESVQEITNSSEFTSFIPKNDTEKNKKEVKTLIRSLSKNTESAWDDVEPDTKKQFMIIDMPERSKARDFLLSKDVGKRVEITKSLARKSLPIVNGIEYNSSSDWEPLIYMEV